MACLFTVLWASQLDELPHTEKPVSKFSQEFLSGLILDIEVDKFGERKQQLLVLLVCPLLSLLNFVESMLSAQRWPGPSEPSRQEDW